MMGQNKQILPSGDGSFLYVVIHIGGIKMFYKRLEALDARNKAKKLIGLYLKKGEKENLYNLCVKYNIPITYKGLFSDDTHYYLWGIRETGIGLIGTVVMNYLKDNKGLIFESLEDLEKHLKSVKLH